MLVVWNCPWCGQVAKFYPGGNYVECTDFLCEARGPTVKFVKEMRDGETAEQEAVDSWNTVAMHASRHFS